MGGGAMARGWVFLSGLAVLLVLAAPAHGAVPGQNGKIAFSLGGDIWVMHPDGSGAVDITNDGEGAASFDPAWSPDGDRIATHFFDSFEASHIETMNADGTGRVGLPGTSDFDSSPDWSPDGTRLVFDFSYDGGNSGLRTATPAGTDVQFAGSGTTASWSPDGTRIAFARRRPDVCSTCWSIDTSNPDGTAVTGVYVHTGLVNRPDWSPDGSRLVFQRQGANLDVYAIDVDGTDLTPLTNDPAQDSNPAWSPDGAKVVFSSGRSPPGIYVMNADGTAPAFVHTGGEPDWQPIPGPQRSDFKNQPAYCRAQREFLGDQQFTARYGSNGNGANAHGTCVSGR